MLHAQGGTALPTSLPFDLSSLPSTITDERAEAEHLLDQVALELQKVYLSNDQQAQLVRAHHKVKLSNCKLENGGESLVQAWQDAQEDHVLQTIILSESESCPFGDQQLHRLIQLLSDGAVFNLVFYGENAIKGLLASKLACNSFLSIVVEESVNGSGVQSLKNVEIDCCSGIPEAFVEALVAAFKHHGGSRLESWLHAKNTFSFSVGNGMGSGLVEKVKNNIKKLTTMASNPQAVPLDLLSPSGDSKASGDTGAALKPPSDDKAAASFAPVQQPASFDAISGGVDALKLRSGDKFSATNANATASFAAMQQPAISGADALKLSSDNKASATNANSTASFAAMQQPSSFDAISGVDALKPPSDDKAAASFAAMQQPASFDAISDADALKLRSDDKAMASFGGTTKQPGALLSTTTGTAALKLPSDDEASAANAKASFGATKQPGALKQTAQTPLRRSKRTRTPRKLY